MDTAPMIASLDEIVAHLSALGRGVVPLLQAGLSDAELTAVEATLPFLLSSEMLALYRWRDGTAAAEGESLNTLTFFPGFYFPSLEEAVQIYHERKDSPQWRGGWFPVFADGAGDFYIVPCESTRKDSAGVIGFIHGEPDQPVEYESLTTMLQTIAACYAQGAFFVDDDGCLEIDDDAHHRIANRFNPEIPEWQS